MKLGLTYSQLFGASQMLNDTALKPNEPDEAVNSIREGLRCCFLLARSPDQLFVWNPSIADAQTAVNDRSANEHSRLGLAWHCRGMDIVYGRPMEGGCQENNRLHDGKTED